jgi:hypothetical protein
MHKNLQLTSIWRYTHLQLVDRIAPGLVLDVILLLCAGRPAMLPVAGRLFFVKR